MHIDSRAAAVAAILLVSHASAQDAHVQGRMAPRPLAARSLSASPARALLSNVPGAPSATIPGLPGAVFQPGTSTSHFDRVYGHPTGHWVLTAFADRTSDQDECLIADGMLVIREGTPAPWVAGGAENCGTMDQRCAINGAGDLVFATNTSGSVNDDWIVTWSGGTFGHAAREGDPVPGLSGATLDDALDSCVLLDSGAVGFAADGIDGVASTAVNDVIVLGSMTLMQEGQTVPEGQSSSPGVAIENFDLGDFWASADGARWLVQGDLEGSTGADDVVIVDGAVVVQEGTVLPGSGYSESVGAGGVSGVSMDAAGSWFARGGNAGGHDWVLRDGSVIAETGVAVVPGAGEAWDDTGYAPGFFAAVGNGLGSFAVGGVTDHPESGLDAVIVLDGERVVARESDPVDLDGDGLLNDNAYIDTFGDDDLTFLDGIRLVGVVTLKDGAGQRIGQGLVEFDTHGGIGLAHCAGTVNSSGGSARLAAVGSASVADNGLGLYLECGPPGSSATLIVGRARGSVPGFNGSQGVLCLAGNIGVLVGPSNIASLDGAGAGMFGVDLTALPIGAQLATAQAGETWQFQAWFRDVDGSGAATSNTSSAVEVLMR